MPKYVIERDIPGAGKLSARAPLTNGVATAVVASAAVLSTARRVSVFVSTLTSRCAPIKALHCSKRRICFGLFDPAVFALVLRRQSAAARSSPASTLMQACGNVSSFS